MDQKMNIDELAIHPIFKYTHTKKEQKFQLESGFS